MDELPQQPQQTPPPNADIPVQPPVVATNEFKPNIYPILYWALSFGVIAGIFLALVWWFSQYITVVWAFVFLGGAGWGAYRNYKKQKNDWTRNQGGTPQQQSALNEFRDAARDIVSAGRDMMAEQRAEDVIAEEEALTEAEAVEETTPTDTPPPTL